MKRQRILAADDERLALEGLLSAIRETAGESDVTGFEDPEEEQNEERFTNLLMAAWVYEQFTSIPKKGDSFTYYNLKITVSEITHNRIVMVRVDVTQPEGKEAAE